MIARLLGRWADTALRAENADLRRDRDRWHTRAIDMRGRAIAARKTLADATATLRELREAQR